MTKIDFAKSAIQRITDYIGPRRVVFHYVPKCEGTPVGRSLRSAHLMFAGRYQVLREGPYAGMTGKSLRIGHQNAGRKRSGYMVLLDDKLQARIAAVCTRSGNQERGFGTSGDGHGR